MKEKKPCVSVLVPVFNTARYLRQCMDSLVRQTLKRIEIVCVDDGSTDASGAILDEYAARDARIRVVHKENGGLPSARNVGLDVARGEYVGFVDSDDYVKEDMFKRLYRAAKKKKADVVVCGAIPFPDPPSPGKWLTEVLTTRDKTYDGFSPDILFREKGARPFLWRDLIRRELIEKNGLRLDEDVIVGEDQAFQFKVFPRAGRVTFLSDKLYFYRHDRAGSIMATARGRTEDRVRKHLLLLDRIFADLSASGKLSACAAELYDWSVRFVGNDLPKLCFVARKEAAETLLALYARYGLDRKYHVFGARVVEEKAYVDACLSPADPPLVSLLVDGTDPAMLAGFRRSLGSVGVSYEILLVNRGCPGNRYDALRSYAKEDGRVRLLNYPAGTPPHVAFNECIRAAKGDCLLFLPRPAPLRDPSFFEKVLAARLVGAQVVARKTEGLPDAFTFAVSRELCEEKRIVTSDFSRLGLERTIAAAVAAGKTVWTEEEGFRSFIGPLVFPNVPEMADDLRDALLRGKGTAFAEAFAATAYGEAFVSAMRGVKREDRARAYNALVRLSKTVNELGYNRTGDALLPVCRDVFPG